MAYTEFLMLYSTNNVVTCEMGMVSVWKRCCNM